ncbi:MAG: type II toxin-antitoxin system Phd/YefM family antitoxin [Solirubrobacteraceae bacterium]
MTAIAFARGRNIAIKIPPYLWEETVRYYRNVVGLEVIDHEPTSAAQRRLRVRRLPALDRPQGSSPRGRNVDTSIMYDVYMADVGVRELKQRLSEYLDRAERGELLLVTERGRPKALLGPLPGRARVKEGVAEGWITPASESGLGVVRRWKSPQRVLDTLAEDRAE